MTVNLRLRGFSCDLFDLATWEPAGLEDVHAGIVIRVGADGVEGTNIFYARIATPEAIRASLPKSGLPDRGLIIVPHFDYEALRERLHLIVEQASRDTWHEGCLVLTRFFEWEYEDYEPSDLR